MITRWNGWVLTALRSQKLQTVKEYLELQEPGAPVAVWFYQDPLVSLNKLYSLDTVLEQALQKRVWLKSGGYLVIEVTEAMVVIDVNTGKYAGRKNLEDTIRMTNLEAHGKEHKVTGAKYCACPACAAAAAAPEKKEEMPEA